MQENCFLYDKCNHKDCDKAFCLRRYKIELLYSLSNLSDEQKKFVKLYPDADGTDLYEYSHLVAIEKDIYNWVNFGDKHGVKNLLIHSKVCGNGKTSWSLRLINAYINKVWPKCSADCHALFISVPRFLVAVKNNISSRDDYATFILDNVMKADLVVWDDIAAKAGSEFEINQLFSLIDGRIVLGKSNIYTSNLTNEEIANALGERLASRICNFSDNITFRGADKRSLAQEEDEEDEGGDENGN